MLLRSDRGADAGQPPASTGRTLAAPPVYLNRTDQDSLGAARQRIAARETWGREDIYLVRPAPSSDGPPFRSVLIYRASGGTDVERIDDPRIPQAHTVGVYRARAIHYQALRIGSPFVWESDLLEGRAGFFLTGTSGTSSPWRLARVEADALDRQVLTLVPVRLPHAIPMANFDSVADGILRQYLTGQFTAFQLTGASDFPSTSSSRERSPSLRCCLRQQFIHFLHSVKKAKAVHKARLLQDLSV